MAADASTTKKGPGVSACGIPYRFRVGGRTVASGSCAGMLGQAPPRVGVRVGRRFSVRIGHELDGRLDFPVPAPAGPGVRLLGRRGSTARYVARTAGTTVLLSRHTRYCANADPRIATCPVLRVRVVVPAHRPFIGSGRGAACPRAALPLKANSVAGAARLALHSEHRRDRPRLIFSALAAQAGARGSEVRHVCGRRAWHRTVVVAITLRRFLPSASLSDRVSYVARTRHGYTVYALGH